VRRLTDSPPLTNDAMDIASLQQYNKHKNNNGTSSDDNIEIGNDYEMSDEDAHRGTSEGSSSSKLSYSDEEPNDYTDGYDNTSGSDHTSDWTEVDNSSNTDNGVIDDSDLSSSSPSSYSSFSDSDIPRPPPLSSSHSSKKSATTKRREVIAEVVPSTATTRGRKSDIRTSSLPLPRASRRGLSDSSSSDENIILPSKSSAPVSLPRAETPATFGIQTVIQHLHDKEK
jgi:hypothetical protein